MLHPSPSRSSSPRLPLFSFQGQPCCHIVRWAPWAWPDAGLSLHLSLWMGLCLAGLRAALRGAGCSLSPPSLSPARSIPYPAEEAGRQWPLPAPSFAPRSPFPAFVADCHQPWLSRQPWPGRTHSFRAKQPMRGEQMTVSSVGSGSSSAGPDYVCWQCSQSRIGSLAMDEGWARASSRLGAAPTASFSLAVGMLRQPGSFLGAAGGLFLPQRLCCPLR